MACRHLSDDRPDWTNQQLHHLVLLLGSVNPPHPSGRLYVARHTLKKIEAVCQKTEEQKCHNATVGGQ